MNSRDLQFVVIACSIALVAGQGNGGSNDADFEAQVADHIKKFPAQDTHSYAQKYTGGDASKLNVWVLGTEPSLVKTQRAKRGPLSP